MSVCLQVSMSLYNNNNNNETLSPMCKSQNNASTNINTFKVSMVPGAISYVSGQLFTYPNVICIWPEIKTARHPFVHLK